MQLQPLQGKSINCWHHWVQHFCSSSCPLLSSPHQLLTAATTHNTIVTTGTTIITDVFKKYSKRVENVIIEVKWYQEQKLPLSASISASFWENEKTSFSWSSQPNFNLPLNYKPMQMIIHLMQLYLKKQEIAIMFFSNKLKKCIGCTL